MGTEIWGIRRRCAGQVDGRLYRWNPQEKRALGALFGNTGLYLVTPFGGIK